MNTERYKNCYIGKDGLDVKHLLSFNEYTGRYSSSAFMGGNMLTADEIDELYYVYNMNDVLVNATQHPNKTLKIDIMNIERIREIQEETTYPNSISVKQALLQVWNECAQSNQQHQIQSAEEFGHYSAIEIIHNEIVSLGWQIDELFKNREHVEPYRIENRISKTRDLHKSLRALKNLDNQKV